MHQAWNNYIGVEGGGGLWTLPKITREWEIGLPDSAPFGKILTWVEWHFRIILHQRSIFVILFTGYLVQTASSILPFFWLKMMSWLNFSGPSVKIQEDVPRMKDLLHKDIPVLNDYLKMPHHTYWENFPFRELPEKPYTKINTEKLAYLLNERRHLMTECEWGRGWKL